MATTTAVSIVYGGDFCFPYSVEVERSFWKPDPLAAGVAFLVGAIVGALIGMLCAKLCMKDIVRSKQNHQESWIRAEKGLTVNTKVAPAEESLVTAENPPQKSTKRRTKSVRRRRPGSSKSEDLVEPVSLFTISDDEQLTNGTPRSTDSRGLADVLLQPTGEAMDSELSNQDLDAVKEFETQQQEESINTMVQMLRVLLQQQMMKGGLDSDQSKDIVKMFQNDVSDKILTANREKKEQEEELKKKYAKDPEKLDDELQNLHSKHMSKLNSLTGELTERLRKDIQRNSKLPEEDVDTLMSRLAAQMAESEQRLAEERSRQAMSLEERLARRRELAEMHRIQREQKEKDIVRSRDIHDQTLQDLVDDGKMIGRQRQDLLDAYEDDLRRIHMRHEEDSQAQKLVLLKKLKCYRENRLAKLAEQQEKDRKEFLQRSAQSSSTDSVPEAFHTMVVQQREEKDRLLDDLADNEAAEFNKLLQNNEREKEEIGETEERLSESLITRAQLSDREAERIMAIHQAQMDEYEKSKKAERKRMRAIMHEKHEQRRHHMEEESMIAQAEETALREQQTNTINKVLDSQLELDEQAKEKILREHEQHMDRINYQLQMSKLRQQKVLEQKLNKRRAHVADLRQQREKALQEVRGGKEKEKEKLAQQLGTQIEEEERNLEKTRQDEVNALRRRLAEETAEALQDQEKHMSLLIARLEVGAARRQAIISKQDQTIKQLQEQMTNKVVEHKEDVSSSQVDHIIAKHTQQVEALEDKLHETRERQELSLQERLQTKRLKKESEVEKVLEKKAQEEWLDQKKSGAGLATSILSQVMLEQRHKMAMNQLEKEMQNEMQKQRAELNRELEVEMQAELEEQKKSFLAQLAAISNMSKNEINEVVENAVADAGGDEKTARKLAKEFRVEMKRVKTDLEPEHQDYSSLRRTPTGYEDPWHEEIPRPKSGRRTPRNAYFL